MVSPFPLCYRQQRYYFSEWYDSWLPQVQHPHCDTRGRSSRDSQGPFSALQDEVNNFIYDHQPLVFILFMMMSPCGILHKFQYRTLYWSSEIFEHLTQEFRHWTMDWTTYCLSCQLVNALLLHTEQYGMIMMIHELKSQTIFCRNGHNGCS